MMNPEFLNISKETPDEVLEMFNKISLQSNDLDLILAKNQELIWQRVKILSKEKKLKRSLFLKSMATAGAILLGSFAVFTLDRLPTPSINPMLIVGISALSIILGIITGIELRKMIRVRSDAEAYLEETGFLMKLTLKNLAQKQELEEQRAVLNVHSSSSHPSC